MDEELLTCADAAVRLGVCEQRVRAMRAAGLLAGVQRPRLRQQTQWRWMFELAEVERVAGLERPGHRPALATSRRGQAAERRAAGRVCALT